MIWKHLGFKRDIFFIEPLRPFYDDMQLFVGRDEEIKTYLIDALSGSRSLKIVTGEIGVGKTTFVNACQYYSYITTLPLDFKFTIPKILPCFEKIQIRESDTLDDIFIQSITAICQSIVQHCRMNSIDPPKTVKDILSQFLDLIINGGGTGFNIGIASASIGISKSSKMQNILRNSRIILKDLIDISQNEFGFNGTFIVVNNLDILSKSKLIKFINEARDELFDITGIYWTFIGRRGLGSIIETESDRVADYLSGTELLIAPLQFDKAIKVIDVRVQQFREKDEINCPLNAETIAAVHHLSLQEIRETLKICGEIVKRVIKVNPSLSEIPSEIAMSAFIQYAHERSKELDLSSPAVNVLKAVYDNKSCRPKDFKKYGYKTAQGFISALKGLVMKRLLSVEEKGRARIYRMTGMTIIAAITGALGKEIQQMAQKNLRDAQQLKRYDNRFNDAQLELNIDSP